MKKNLFESIPGLYDSMYNKALEQENKDLEEDKLYKEFKQELKDKYNISIEFMQNLFQLELPYLKYIFPLLKKYIENTTFIKTKRHMFRLLGCKGFYDATEYVIAEIDKFNEADGFVWDLCNCLYEIGDKRYIDKYIEIIKREYLGSGRQMLILLIGRFKVVKAINLLIQLLDDPTCYGHALDALSKFNDKSLIVYFERFKDDKHSWVKKIAVRQITKLTEKK